MPAASNKLGLEVLPLPSSHSGTFAGRGPLNIGDALAQYRLPEEATEPLMWGGGDLHLWVLDKPPDFPTWSSAFCCLSLARPSISRPWPVGGASGFIWI